jgi:ribonuclease E/ribonuclease G
MSERLLLVESDIAGLRAALLADRWLQAVEIDRAGRAIEVGSVSSAKVIRAIGGLGTTVEMRNGSQMLLDHRRGKSAPSAGEMLTLQIVHPPRGAKLGTVTRSVSLAGRGVIHLPFESRVSMSRRLDLNADRRAALEALVAGRPGGWIFRRSASGLSADDLSVEISTLAAQGHDLRLPEASLAAPDAFRRLAVDYSVDRILAAGLAAQRLVELWCRDFAPSMMARVEKAPPGLFDLHDLDGVIASLADSHVALVGGGSLIIEHTEAMTVIDVNAGAEPNVLNVNLAAASEIARQLRLRHIGGIVIIDFISMARPRDKERVMKAFTASVADDPAQTYILPMSPLGLVEMTRERRGPGLEFDPS